MTKPKVLVAIAEGSEELEAVTVIDTLTRAGAAVTTTSVMPSHDLAVTCMKGTKILADCAIDTCAASTHRWDLVVCPGGMPGADHLSRSAALHRLLAEQAARGGLIGAICAAPALVLAKHGLLAHKRATCYPSSSSLTSLLPHFVDERVVVDGHIITSQGPGTALEFSLALVEALFGRDKAHSVRDEMIAK